jgi:hypothetical protein
MQCGSGKLRQVSTVVHDEHDSGVSAQLRHALERLEDISRPESLVPELENLSAALQDLPRRVENVDVSPRCGFGIENWVERWKLHATPPP